VTLWGRLAAPAQERTLPSGDVIVTLRVVIPRRGRPPRQRGADVAVRRARVDTIDVVCWTAAARRAALRLGGGDAIEVEGSLRRRFFGGAAGRQSRYEVEAAVVRRLSGSRRSAS
jgi:single-strand DNA-binding protein